MSIEFSPQPGPRERHLRRKYRNPLFTDGGTIDAQQVDEARRQDVEDLEQFLEYFRALVQEAVELEPNTDSDVIIDLKERLDQCYVNCCAMPGEQREIKQSLNKLIQVIMAAIRRGATNDPVALGKLDEEEEARQTHFWLADEVLVADLIRNDSPIHEDELVPTLLSESQASVQAALQLFDAEQLSSIYQQARQLLQECEQKAKDVGEARQRLAQIEAALGNATSQVTIN